jgi:hypothetical protein
MINSGKIKLNTKKLSLLMLLVLGLLTACRCSKENNRVQSMKIKKAVKVAEEASRKVMNIPRDVEPVIEQTKDNIIVTYPLVLPKGVRGADYYTKVTIDKKTGKLISLLVGS